MAPPALARRATTPPSREAPFPVSAHTRPTSPGIAVATCPVPSSPSARCAPLDGLAGCYVFTIGKPHEYFDLTGILGQKKLEILDTMLDGKEPVDGPSRLTGSNLPGHMRC